MRPKYMIETGGLFHLLLNLMTLATTANGASVPSMHSLVFLLGRHFAIRDDYQNLLSDEVREKRHFEFELI